MSADNWRVCPRCLKAARLDHAAAQRTVNDAYGKVSFEKFEKFMKLKEKADKPFKEPDDTLREDYEIGINTDGEFYAIYSGRCETCGFSFTFKKTEDAKA